MHRKAWMFLTTLFYKDCQNCKTAEIFLTKMSLMHFYSSVNLFNFAPEDKQLKAFNQMIENTEEKLIVGVIEET